jgi:nitric oxide reductase large subunit
VDFRAFVELLVLGFELVGVLALVDFVTLGFMGLLALGLALFCLRYLIPAERWPEKWARISFWSANIGLAWMCFATLLPLGILQLYKSVDSGYFEARQLKFLTNDTNTSLSRDSKWITCRDAGVY